MKKIVMLEERDYKRILSELDQVKDIVKRMRRTQNIGHIEYHIDKAIQLLIEEDSSVQDMQNRIAIAEAHIPY